jgi:uncharacterized membrane protein YhaH (DUF805 family)
MPMIENWKLVVLERYAKFDGRAGRAEFWWYALANIVLNIAVWILVGIGFAIATGLGVVLIVLAAALYLALIVPSIAVAIRRLHDTDKSGWYLLIGLIPFVGYIILIVFYVLEGTAGPNQYGAGPEPAAG